MIFNVQIVWKLTEYIIMSGQPRYKWNDHKGEVTDVGNIPNVRQQFYARDFFSLFMHARCTEVKRTEHKYTDFLFRIYISSVQGAGSMVMGLQLFGPMVHVRIIIGDQIVARLAESVFTYTNERNGANSTTNTITQTM